MMQSALFVRTFRLVVALAALGMLVPCPAGGEVVTLKSGVQLEGRIGMISSLDEDPFAPNASQGPVDNKLIVLLDDQLRRMYVSKYMIQGVPGTAPGPGHEKIKVWQPVADAGRRVASVGPLSRVTPFDEYGRRIVTMTTAQGTIDVIQGITEITPTYVKVEGLKAENNSYVWETRVATSSIPRDTLSKILMRQVDAKNPDDRLRIVRLYLQAERYRDAQLELEQALEDFPELADLKKQVTALQQLYAQRLVDEIQFRRDAGQHRYAYTLLSNFPADGIAGETLLRVSEMLEEYRAAIAQREKVLQLFGQHLQGVDDQAMQARLQTLQQELSAELNLNTLDRMADYLRLGEAESLETDQKISLAVSGWLLGNGSGIDNLAVSIGLIDVRELVRDYLRSTNEGQREELLERLSAMEGSSPQYIAKLLAHMKPAVDSSLPEQGIPGLYLLTVPGTADQPEFQYYVQLPPEYDPHRPYPCIVTLNSNLTTELQQIDWWAGGYDEQLAGRLGQATRRGYIVLAPKWTKEGQHDYTFTAREHAAVLYSLRDASRRFSIDTDRIFLSGHSMGGDAAWDIGLAHPDLWAGVLPIVATTDKYISRYWENAKNVPFYFVIGELDGNTRSLNAREFDRYLTRSNYDVLVVEYRGRGHEHFHDEVIHLFDWMARHKRDFFPREFEAVSMRPWDNFFWWVELEELPSRSMVLPLNWPPGTGSRPAATTASLLPQNNSVSVSTGAAKATVWLAPEMVDFQQPVNVRVNDPRGRPQTIQPSSEVLLEDVRTRGDRQHPFWAKVEVQTGRRG